jgi:hypothetical protein
MSIIKFLSSIMYTPPANKISLDSINQKFNDYQKTLEDLGFAVRRADQTIYFTPAQMLIATREQTILEITMDVTGFEEISFFLKSRGFGAMPLQLADFGHALAIMGAKATATPVKEKKIA